jgi:hypothetical protein
MLNIAGGLLLTGMTDVASSRRLLIGAVLVGNVLLLVGKRALAKKPARLGASASLIGYAGAVISWLVQAFGCGIEYYNATCDAFVTPLITACVILGLVGLPIGRICGAFVKADAPQRPGRSR